MKKKFKPISTTASLFKLVVAGSLSLCFADASFAAPHYVAHEWGTFTSVQGADGVQQHWNPLSVSDLPGFVYDWAKSGPESDRVARLQIGSKLSSMALQRMETPVIYFYSDEAMTVNAHVKFPQGTMTEWYPKAILPVETPNAPALPNTLRWDTIRLIPGSGGAPNSTGDARLPSLPGATALANDTSGSHYYAARETDANLLQVNGETEKFLFYRGVGNFRAPLTVTQTGDDVETVTLQNTGNDELRHLFVYQRNAAGGRFTHVPGLAAGASQAVKLGASVPFTSPTAARSALAGELEKALTREGLYPREARAMVKTWEDSWLGEKGVRVLYTLSGRWANQTLPLTLDPKPAEETRVMVGRAELITPQMEWGLMREIVRFGNGSPADREQAVAGTRALGLGRFLEPTIGRLTSRMPSQALTEQSYGLLTALGKQESAGKGLAATAVKPSRP